MPRHEVHYNPADPGATPPATSEEAKEALLDGNRRFADWITSCRAAVQAQGSRPSRDQVNELVLSCGGLASILEFAEEDYPTQKPFAVVVGCSDARAPMEMIFGQGYNDLFVVRNAGNVMSDVASGSVDYTLGALADSVRAIVVMGHTGCGAVTGAVGSYLNPSKYWARTTSPNLRVILQRIFVAVRESHRAIREVWGPTAAERPDFVETLTDTAIFMNAAHTALELRELVDAAGASGIEVYYAVYDVRSHLVRVPPGVGDAEGDGQGLTIAPNGPEDLVALARQIAEATRPA